MSHPLTRKVTMRPLSEVFDVAAPPEAMVPVFDERTEFVPPIDDIYVFEKEQIKQVLQWLDGSFGRNLMVNGPTGAGKTSVILQVCARLNIEVFLVGCHNRLEFSEMLGSMQLVQGALRRDDGLFKKAAASVAALLKGAGDGESMLEWFQRSFSSVVTRYAYGAASLAAMRGGVLLCDEFNFLNPGTVGGMNTILDAGPLVIPETAEVVRPHARFRIAVTGNALDGEDNAALYRGIQSMNVAMADRFLAMHVDYMEALQEYRLITRISGLPSALVTDLITIANEVRAGFKGGTVAKPISTRALIRWVRLIDAQRAMLGSNPAKLIVAAMRFGFLNTASPADADAMVKLAEKTIKSVYKSDQLVTATTAAAKPASNAAGQPVVTTAGPEAALRSQGGTALLLVKSESGQPQFWGGVMHTSGSGHDDLLITGNLGDVPPLQVKQTGYLASMTAKKLQAGFRVVEVPNELNDISQELRALCVDHFNVAIAGSKLTNVSPKMRATVASILSLTGLPAMA